MQKRGEAVFISGGAAAVAAAGTWAVASAVCLASANPHNINNIE